MYGENDLLVKIEQQELVHSLALLVRHELLVEYLNIQCSIVQDSLEGWLWCQPDTSLHYYRVMGCLWIALVIDHDHDLDPALSVAAAVLLVGTDALLSLVADDNFV